MNQLKEEVDEMLSAVDNNSKGGLKKMAIQMYLRGVRDALAGADLEHIKSNVNKLCE